MKVLSPILFTLVCLSIFTSNWSCSGLNGTNLSIRLDSINNALLYTVDGFAFLESEDLSTVDEVGFCWNKTGHPTVSDSMIAYTSPMIHEINSTVGNFTPSTSYYIRAFARSESKIEYSNEKSFTTWDGKIQDADGIIYNGTQVGNQGWMAENLRSTRYNNGQPITIQNGSNRTYWYGSGHVYVPNFDEDIDQDGDFDMEDSLLYVHEYGLLYSWFSANNIYDHANNPTLLGVKVYPDVRDACPLGWHLPSDFEFQDLRNFLEWQHGHEAYAHHLTTQTGWADNLNGLDTYHFGLKPSAYWHEPDVQHSNILGRAAFLWMSSEGNEDNGFYLQTDNVSKRFLTGSIGKSQHGLCIRCIKDKINL